MDGFLIAADRGHQAAIGRIMEEKPGDSKDHQHQDDGISDAKSQAFAKVVEKLTAPTSKVLRDGDGLAS
jgi:hypothetical protein